MKAFPCLKQIVESSFNRLRSVPAHSLHRHPSRQSMMDMPLDTTFPPQRNI
jgi:hypothetical protein